MNVKKIQISIIIVNYKAEKELFACIASIFNSKIKSPFEVIVVDNDDKNEIQRKLKEQFSQVKYVKSSGNIGFGAGNNLGTRFSSGNYLFFVNPDVVVQEGTVDTLLNFANKKLKVGMVSPLLLDLNGKVHSIQGRSEYGFANALITSSFVNKYFPNNPISIKFFYKNWNNKGIKEVDVVPGAAFMIKKSLFEKIGMFDERFFLYFEEHDLAKRLKKISYKNYIIPEARAIHIQGASTKKNGETSKIFSQSRYLFFRKNYGYLFASIVDFISDFGKYEVGLGIILLTSLALNFNGINKLMIFMGDQGWFYLSAKSMLLNGQIPLVGITSSHIWLHQGPFWTYILAIIFWLSHFNPLAPGYFSAAIGVVTVLFMYRIGSKMFSRRIGLISALLYATSPLIVLSSRMPYHTNLIPLFTLFFIYSVYRWINGRMYYFPVILLVLAILYNFEIETALLWFALAALILFGILKKEKWLRNVLNVKIFILSLVALAVPMIPMLIYDTTHEFSQTLKFGLWVVYRVARVFGFPNIHGNEQFPNITPFAPYTFKLLQQMIFLPNLLISAILLAGSFLTMTYDMLVQFKKNNSGAYVVIYLLLIIAMIGYVVIGTASFAYFPLFFPFLMLMLAIGFDYFLCKKWTYTLTLVVILSLSIFNVTSLLQQNYLTKNGYGPEFSKRISATELIVKNVNGKAYNLVGKGFGSQFQSFTMNYEYLTWWFGHAPSNRNENLKIYISESQNGIGVEKIDLNK